MMAPLARPDGSTGRVLSSTQPSFLRPPDGVPLCQSPNKWFDNPSIISTGVVVAASAVDTPPRSEGSSPWAVGDATIPSKSFIGVAIGAPDMGSARPDAVTMAGVIWYPQGNQVADDAVIECIGVDSLRGSADVEEVGRAQERCGTAETKVDGEISVAIRSIVRTRTLTRFCSRIERFRAGCQSNRRRSNSRDRSVMGVLSVLINVIVTVVSHTPVRIPGIATGTGAGYQVFKRTSRLKLFFGDMHDVVTVSEKAEIHTIHHQQ